MMRCGIEAGYAGDSQNGGRVMGADSGGRTGGIRLRRLTSLVFVALLQAIGAGGPVVAGAAERAPMAPITALGACRRKGLG